MRKSKISSLIIAFAITIAGLIIFTVGISALKFDFSRLNMSESVTESYEINQPFSNISIQNTQCDVRFVITDNGTCNIDYSGLDKLEHTFEVKDNTLTIIENDNRKWYEYIGIFWGKTEITLYLPENKYSLLGISGTTCDIELPESFEFESVDIKTSTGDIEVFSDVKNTLSVKTDTGDVEIVGINPESIRLETDTGDIYASGVIAENGIVLSTDTGDTEFCDISCDSLEIKSDTGDVELEKVICRGVMKIESDTGDVELESCDAETLQIKTSTGDVSGRLLSEKVFITETDTGNVSVPKTITGGKCEVITNTGDIRFK